MSDDTTITRLTERLLKGSRPLFFESQILAGSGPIWVASVVNPIPGADGTSERFVIVDTDITKRKKIEEELRLALVEKEILFKEVHHRVKNNLQIISSLFNIQKRYVSDPKVQEAILEAQNRIKSISLIHQNLYQVDNITEVNFADYIGQLAGFLFDVFKISNENISIRQDVGPYHFDLEKAIPIGLIFNELLSNILKYAFPDGRSGVVEIGLTRIDSDFQFTVSDNGVGMPVEGSDRKDSMGLRLVNALVGQLGGTIEIQSGKGVTTCIRFPADAAA
jgi:two-component sensor histidine kinase